MQFFKKIDVISNLPKLTEILVQAKKEDEIQKSVNRIEQFWKSYVLTFVPYKDSKEIFVFGKNEQILTMSDEYLIELNNLMSSRFIADFKDKIEQQLKFFVIIQLKDSLPGSP